MYLQVAQPRLAEIKGIGIDIAPISKIASLVNRYNSELTLLFTPGEIEQCQSAPYPSRYYAVCFAAKEAVGKALGTGLVDINWNEIESTISQSELTIELRGAARQKALHSGVKAWLATWCYWDDYVMVHVLSKGE
ncbi:holo-ACP synthase [Chroococcidiopsis sp. TS-821]|uniref:holo-ACP synthase n=1 Tax=Chroococcidiopsis sp. TS-821 TaxID=1378066 RepID=UPI000D45B6B5|nr:4'-phosphopantetheinyl transferase superfamily protein [Chroococcidiopsis sp. TS-821]PPS43597.1 ACP synthase [Chroococcidiopsis sp. TS-821]